MQRMLNAILRTEVRSAIRPGISALANQRKSPFSTSTKKVQQELYLPGHAKDDRVSIEQIEQEICGKWTDLTGQSNDNFYLRCIRDCYGESLTKATAVKILNKSWFNRVLADAYRILKSKMPEQSDKQIFHEMIATDSNNLNIFCRVLKKYAHVLSENDVSLLYKNKNTFDWENLEFLCLGDEVNKTWGSIKEILLSNKTSHFEALAKLRENFSDSESLYIIANLNSVQLYNFQQICSKPLCERDKVFLIETLIEDPHLISTLKYHLKCNASNLSVAISKLKADIGETQTEKNPPTNVMRK